jgi:hypothetical protein
MGIGEVPDNHIIWTTNFHTNVTPGDRWLCRVLLDYQYFNFFKKIFKVITAWPKEGLTSHLFRR